MNPSDYIRLDLSDPGQAREAETRFGLRSQGSGKPNLLLVHGGARVMAGLLSFAGEGNEIAFGEDCGFNGEVFVYGDKARVDIGGGQGLLALQLNIIRTPNASSARGRCPTGRGYGSARERV